MSLFFVLYGLSLPLLGSAGLLSFSMLRLLMQSCQQCLVVTILALELGHFFLCFSMVRMIKRLQFAICSKKPILGLNRRILIHRVDSRLILFAKTV